MIKSCETDMINVQHRKSCMVTPTTPSDLTSSNVERLSSRSPLLWKGGPLGHVLHLNTNRMSYVEIPAGLLEFPLTLIGQKFKVTDI